VPKPLGHARAASSQPGKLPLIRGAHSLLRHIDTITSLDKRPSSRARSLEISGSDMQAGRL
jgi:hypothetical protein